MAKVGHPKDKERTDAFLEVATFHEENDDEQITIHDLISCMEDNLADSEHGAYSYPPTHAAETLGIFGDTIIETEIDGKPNVVTFRNKAKVVLHDFCSQQKADLDTEK